MFIVLGTGRSGTSLVAGILHNLGVSMGTRLLGAGPANPTGHFEDMDFVELNDKILEAAGGAADNPPLESNILLIAPEFNLAIGNLLSARSGLWGWKDPRTSMTFKTYLPHLDSPRLIFVQRNYDDTVRSLHARDPWRSLERTHRLVKEVGGRVDSIKALGLDSITVDYDILRASPNKEVARIADFVGVALNEAATKLVLSKQALDIEKSKW